MVVGGQDIDQIRCDHLPGELLRSGCRYLVMASQASHVDLEQCSQALPGAHHLERLVAREVTVALGMSDHDLAAGIHYLANHILVIALEIEAELHQQEPAWQSHVP